MQIFGIEGILFRQRVGWGMRGKGMEVCFGIKDWFVWSRDRRRIRGFLIRCGDYKQGDYQLNEVYRWVEKYMFLDFF